MMVLHSAVLSHGARHLRTLGVLLVTLLPLSPGPARAQTATTVSIDNFTFAPAEIIVAPGATVTWTNADDIPHTVTASDKSFRSKPLDTNDHFSFTFTKAGEYVYFCSLHPHMTGKVIVKAP